MAAAMRSLDIRWIRRYRLFFIFGSIILAIQVFLAYKFFSIHSGDNSNNGLEHFEATGKERVGLGPSFESAGQNEDPNGAVSSRRVKDDDEDSPSNSNAINSLYNKHKVPPDKNNAAGATLNQGSKSVANRTTLRLDELDFVPICNVQTKEAISAIHRSKTQRCKQLLVNVTCLIQSDQLYPTQLPNSCPAPGMSAGKSLGCFKDDKTFRLLSGYYANLKTTNSPQHCVNMCLQSGFPYAGVEYSSECFCGNDPPASTHRVADSSCNMKCSGDMKQACGGYLTLNAFQTGIAKFTAQVARETPVPEEPPARIVFLLTLNGRAVRQVRRLIKLLYHERHYIYIHVDARQDYLFRELVPLERQLPNVRLSRQRSATIWGGASLLQMLLRSMRDLLNLDWRWDFVVNLSESDLPVKTNAALVDFLTANKDRNFVKSHGREVQRFIQKQGLDKTFVECDQHMWRVGTRRLPWGVVLDGGSDWMALSRPFVEHVVAPHEDRLVERLMVMFAHTLLPAESFFHTVLRNTEFCTSYVDNNLHVTNWKRKLGCKCQYKHVVDWCGCSPNDFKIEDWPRIQGTESRQLFFARKFEPIVNQAIILQVEEWLYGPYPPGVAHVSSYWQSVYHHADLSPAPDEALVAVATSVARRGAKAAGGAVARLGLLREVTSYFDQDQYKGALVQYEVAPREGGQPLAVETWIQYVADVTVHDASYTSVQGVLVSSEFDVKEQLCHNLLGTIGPFTEPVLVLTTRPVDVTPFNASVLWIDPTGQLADVQEVHVDTASILLANVRPLLAEPLLPGVWEAKVVHGGAAVISARFLVAPLQYAGANRNKQTAWLLHKNAAPTYAAPSDWDAFLPSQSQREAMQRGAGLNAKREGEDLDEWIDSLTTRFYRIVSSCVDATESSLGLPPCVGTPWSSLAPDPKSVVGRLNSTTGRLVRW